MAKIQDIDIPYLEFAEAAAPGTPASGIVRIYAKSDGSLYQKDDAGTETGLASSSAFIGCLAIRSTDQGSIANDTDTIVVFNGTDVFDTSGFHDPATNASRITIPSGLDGYYRFSTYIIWDGGSSSGFRRVGFKLNGSNANGLQASSIDGRLTDYEMQRVTSDPIALVATDYVEVFVRQNSGSARTLSGSVISLSFAAEFLGT